MEEQEHKTNPFNKSKRDNWVVVSFTLYTVFLITYNLSPTT